MGIQNTATASHLPQFIPCVSKTEDEMPSPPNPTLHPPTLQHSYVALPTL